MIVISRMRAARFKYGFFPLSENAEDSALSRAAAIGALAMDVIADTEVTLLETQRGKSPITKRSVNINGHKTSVSLEAPFWLELKSIAAERKVPLGHLISMIDANRQRGNLSSALRLFVLAKYRPAVDPGSPRPEDQSLARV